MIDYKGSIRVFSQTVLHRAIRLFFHLLYHSFVWAYDPVAYIVSAGRWWDWLSASNNFITGQRILELGFGTGYLQEYLATRRLNIFGLDESSQMVRRTARRLVKRNLPRQLIRGIAQSLPFPSGSLDSIIATFPTNYIFDPDTLAEIKRVLTPEGRLVVLFASWFTGKSIFEMITGFLFRATGQQPFNQDQAENYLLPFTQAGFEAKVKLVEQPKSVLLFIIAKLPK